MASKLLYRCTDVVSAPITLRFLLTSSLASLALIFALTSSLVASISFYRILIPPASLSTPVYLQYGQGIPSAEFTVPKDLKGNQQYDILLAIDAPASRKNLDLGNFMVSLTLSSSKNEVLATSHRPASLSPPPLPWLFIRAVLGLSDTAKLNVALFDRHRLKQATNGFLTVGRPGCELHTYQTHLVFDAHYVGLKYLMHRHRLLALAVLSTLFFFWELLSALLVWSLLSSRPEKAALLPQTKGLLVSPSLPSPKESNVAASTGIANRSATRRQQQRPTESVDSKSFVKTEDETGEGLKEGFFGAKLSVQKTKLEDFDLVDAVKEDEGLESETLIGNAESSDRTRDSEPAPKTDEADDTLSDTSSLSAIQQDTAIVAGPQWALGDTGSR